MDSMALDTEFMHLGNIFVHKRTLLNTLILPQYVEQVGYMIDQQKHTAGLTH